VLRPRADRPTRGAAASSHSMEELCGLSDGRPRGRARLLQLMERLARDATSAEQVVDIGRVGWAKVAGQQHLLTTPDLAPSTARVLALLAGECARRSGG
jgi:hypothetical protein